MNVYTITETTLNQYAMQICGKPFKNLSYTDKCNIALYTYQHETTCPSCGSEKPLDQSCDCFDNHCQ